MHGEGGMHGEGDVHGKGACMARGVHGRGACVGGGMHGGGHAWQGACMAGGCMQERRPFKWVVRILLKCILVSGDVFSSWLTRFLLLFSCKKPCDYLSKGTQ